MFDSGRKPYSGKSVTDYCRYSEASNRTYSDDLEVMTPTGEAVVAQWRIAARRPVVKFSTEGATHLVRRVVDAKTVPTGSTVTSMSSAGWKGPPFEARMALSAPVVDRHRAVSGHQGVGVRPRRRASRRAYGWTTTRLTCAGAPATSPSATRTCFFTGRT